MRPDNSIPSVRRRSFPSLFVCVLSLLGCAASAASKYEVTNLDPDPGFFSQALAINNAGQVLISGSAQMFLWSENQFRQVTSGVDQRLLDSARGLSAGGELTGTLNQMGVRGRPDGYARLSSLISRLGATGAVANAIGASGMAVGTSSGEVLVGPTTVIVRRPVRWSGAKPTDLGTIGGREGVALAVNGSGRIVGWSTTSGEAASHATLWNGAGARDLHTLGVLPNSQANAINDSGVVVGQLKGFTATQILAFVWIEGEGMRELPSTGYSRGTALGVNNHNQIVGALDGSAILWEDGVLVDLQNQLLPGSGWDLDAAYGINDAGWIVGYGKGPGGGGAVLLRPQGWDTNECPALHLEVEVLDPTDFRDGDDVTGKAARLAAGGQPAGALAADGAARVLLRFTASKQNVISLSLRSADGAQGVTGDPLLDGALSSPGGSERRDRMMLTLQEVDGKPRAFAVYHAPQDFVRPGTADGEDIMRIIQLDLKFGDPKCENASRPLALAIVRPPLVVMHGLWSDKEGAFGEFQTELNKLLPGVEISGPNYGNAAPLLANKLELRNHIRSVRKAWRQRQVVVTRPDIFAHSMGGLLSRIWAQTSPAEYLRAENFGRGDLHKLVTIDTPHYGGFPADILDIWEAECPEFFFALTESMRLLGKRIDEGAIKDFRTYSLPMKEMNAGTTTVPAHVISGFLPAAKYSDEILSTLPLIKLLFEEVPVLRAFSGFICDEEIHVPYPNDLIVTVLSQLGGLKGDAIDIFEHIHSGAAGQPSVVKRSLQLMNAPTADAAFAVGFPITSPPFPGTEALPERPQARPAQPRPHGPSNVPLTIVEPAPGTFVNSGKLVDFTVAEPADATLRALLVMTADFVGIRTNPPFSLPVRVPTNGVGPVGIYAMAFDSLGRRLTNAVVVDAHPAAVLNELVVSPSEFHFFSPGSTCQLGVTGRYSDGVARDVTLAITGTTYESSDPAIVSVSVDGLLTPHADGEATITVRKLGSATARVSVQLLPVADLALSLAEAPAEVRTGQSALFKLRVKNQGPATAPDVVVRQLLPAGAHLVTDPAASAGCAEVDGQLKCLLDSLASGAEESLEFALQFAAPGDYPLSWSVNSTAEDVQPDDNVVGSVVQVSVTPRLEIAWQGAKLVLSWSKELTGFLLEASPAVGPEQVWQVIDGAVLVGDHFELGVDPAGSTRYFRLHKP